MGVFSAELYADPQIKGNVKYRNSPYVRGTVKATRIAVSNGNFSNKDIWADNSVELGISWVTAQESNYIVITHSITDPNDPNTVIPWTKIAGEIVSTQYINNNNVNISYLVDHYTSAQLTKDLRGDFFTNAQGLCARTNLTYPSESTANLQPEPYAGGDIKQVDGVMSYQFANEICSKWGLSMANDILNNGFCLIVWISNFAATTITRNGGTVTPWVANACTSPPPQSIHTTTTGFVQQNLESTYIWYGSFSKGYPTVWTDITAMNNFINGILNTVGQEQEIPADGYGSLSNTRWAIIQDSYYTSMGDPDSQTEPLTQTQIITSDDIFNIQIVPLQVATSYQRAQKIESHTYDTGFGLHNFNPMKDERDTVLPDGTIVQDFSKSKLMSYPYWYHTLITNIGNEIVLLPQTKLLPTSIGSPSYLYNFQYEYLTRFIGGDKPRLMIAIVDSSDIYGTIVNGSGTEWNTIWEFPNIPWQSNVDTEQQLQAISSALNRTSQIYSSIIGASVKGTGFMAGYRSGTNGAGDSGGTMDATSSMKSGFQSLMSMSGAGWGMIADALGVRGAFTAKYKDDAQVSQDNMKASANNIVASNPHVIVGEDSIASLLSPPVKVLRCGYTDGELFGFARYLDRQGQSANIIINPITNAGDVFSGNASISSVGNKTYYQFYDMDVVGTMPVFFKDMIAQMFIGGVYLING